MMIGSTTGTNNNMQAGHSGMNMQTDSVSKNIQNQIANAQKQLKEISSNEDMTMEEKMKKKQEIQQEITTLNQQLRQHQIQQRKEQQSKGSSMDDMLGGSQKAESKSGGLSQSSMQAMISADSSLKQAKVQGSMATQMEGKARVLESEIKMDKGRGASTERKETELAGLQEKAQETTEAQLSTLANASKVMEEASRADQTTETSKNNKMDKKGEKTDRFTESETFSKLNNETDVEFIEENVTVEAATSAQTVSRPAYTSIDVRL